jgi:hypothetical protein
VQDSDDRALGQLDLERGARDRERIIERGLGRGPERKTGGGCAVENLLGLESPPRLRPDTAQSKAGVNDRAVFDQQRRGRGGERELVGGSVADLQVAGPRAAGGSGIRICVISSPCWSTFSMSGRSPGRT